MQLELIQDVASNYIFIRMQCYKFMVLKFGKEGSQGKVTINKHFFTAAGVQVVKCEAGHWPGVAALVVSKNSQNANVIWS